MHDSYAGVCIYFVRFKPQQLCVCDLAQDDVVNTVSLRPRRLQDRTDFGVLASLQEALAFWIASAVNVD